MIGIHRVIAGSLVVLAVLVIAASSAVACGSLIAANGAVNLVRTSTLAAYHDGVEHYVTSFEFTGAPETFGSIIPLPDNPTTVEKAGGWTLQRLQQEVNAGVLEFQEFEASARSTTDVQVLREVRIGSLDITILRGGGRAVARWAAEQGFDLTGDAPEVLEFYSERSPFFMAAKFDASAAVAQGFRGGDGIPVHLAIPTDNPWVPLRILATGKPANAPVSADVFLLTDERPSLLHGPGFTVEQSAPASDALLDDLRGDERSQWVPNAGWLTYGKVDARVDQMTYDLAIDADGGTPRLADTGVASLDELVANLAPDDGTSWTWTALAVGSAIAVVALAVWVIRKVEQPERI